MNSKGWCSSICSYFVQDSSHQRVSNYLDGIENITQFAFKCHMHCTNLSMIELHRSSPWWYLMVSNFLPFCRNFLVLTKALFELLKRTVIFQSSWELLFPSIMLESTLPQIHFCYWNCVILCKVDLLKQPCIKVCHDLGCRWSLVWLTCSTSLNIWTLLFCLQIPSTLHCCVCLLD